MARKTIRERLRTLKRRFPHRSRYGFLYRHKLELRRHYTEIIVYSLIYSPQKGHSLFIWNPHRRGFNWTPVEWNEWLNKEGLSTVIDAVMLAISEKRGDNWEFQRLVGFSGDEYAPRGIVKEGKNALYPSIHSVKRKRGNKANGKR